MIVREAADYGRGVNETATPHTEGRILFDVLILCVTTNGSASKVDLARVYNACCGWVWNLDGAETL